jgi:hypothetical protein
MRCERAGLQVRHLLASDAGRIDRFKSERAKIEHRCAYCVAGFDFRLSCSVERERVPDTALGMRRAGISSSIFAQGSNCNVPLVFVELRNSDNFRFLGGRWGLVCPWQMGFCCFAYLVDTCGGRPAEVWSERNCEKNKLSEIFA